MTDHVDGRGWPSDLDDLERQLASVGKWSRAQVVDAVRAAHTADGGSLRRSVALRLAEMSGWSARSLWRIAGTVDGQSRHPSGRTKPSAPATGSFPTFLDRLEAGAGFEFDELALSMVYLLGGNRKRLREELIAAGYDVPSESTICRAWAQVPAPVRDGARFGHGRRYQNLLYIRQDRPTMANTVWQIDSFSLNLHALIEAPDDAEEVAVMRDGAWIGCRPNLTFTIDMVSSFITGWMLLDHEPTSADVGCLFADAFEVRSPEDGSPGFIGGHCPKVISDNASCFTSVATTDWFAGVAAGIDPAFAYQPHQKGGVERTGQTLESMIVTGMPGMVREAETISKTALMSVSAKHWIEFTDLEQIVAAAVYEYNYERVHAAVAATPASVYIAANPAPNPVADEILATRYLPVRHKQGRRVFTDTGVNALGGWWIDAELHRKLEIGDPVTVRRLHHRVARLAVFDRYDEFVSMVYPSGSLTDPQWKAIVDDRRKHASAINLHAARAREAMERVYAQVAGGDNADFVTATVEAHEARVARGSAGAVTPAATTPSTVVPAKRPSSASTPKVTAAEQATKPQSRPPRQNAKDRTTNRPAKAPTLRPDLDAAEAAAERLAAQRRNPAPDAGDETKPAKRPPKGKS